MSLESVKEKYKTARAFRVAIADRITRLARASNQSYEDLYRRVAIDRFLARIDWTHWMAKGGYVLQRRLPKARRTKDIDLSTFDSRFILGDSNSQQKALLAELREQAAQDLDDYFNYQIEFDRTLPGFGKGGIRCIARCILDDQLWSTFQIDAIVQDQIVHKPEIVPGDDFLNFSGIKQLLLTVPVKEEIFAEKIHAYTTPREDENTRVKDLIDLALLLNDGINKTKVSRAICGIFEIRSTHPTPLALQSPPSSWDAAFSEMAFEANLDLTLEEAFTSIAKFYVGLNIKSKNREPDVK